MMQPDGVFRKSRFSQLSNCLEAAWKTSSFSGPGNDACVEVRSLTDVIEVRDSKDRSGPALQFTPAEWQAFVDGARAGEFDLR